jgi:hypothetical protein
MVVIAIVIDYRFSHVPNDNYDAINIRVDGIIQAVFNNMLAADFNHAFIGFYQLIINAFASAAGKYQCFH